MKTSKTRNFFLKTISKRHVLIFFLILIFLFVFLISACQKKTFYIKGEGNTRLKKEIKEIKNPSPFSGIECSQNKKRAIGIIFAQYPQTIPLSGISEADVVIEWPVASPGGITRLLGIFQCKEPREVGSIRSARPYIVDMANGFDVVLVSWGGSESAVEEISNLDIDWLDGRVNVSGAFFRKSSKLPPHNGFANFTGLLRAIKAKNFRDKNEFEGYNFLKIKEIKNKKEDFNLNISNYYYPVKFVYDKRTGNYLRYWNNQPFLDEITKKQVFTKNIVLMKTQMGFLSAGVAWAKVVGEGEARIYQMGNIIEGKWKKNSPKEKLYFLNKDDKEIKFVPGPIWIEIVDKF